MRLYPILLCVLIAFGNCSGFAQFAGISSLLTDSGFVKELRNKGIRSITETFVENGNTRLTTRYLNKRAQVIESTGPWRIKYEYDSLGRVIKVDNYDPADSTKLIYWSSTEYDVYGHAIGGGQGRYDKQPEGYNLKYKLIRQKSSPGYFMTDGCGYMDTFLVQKKYYLDSLAGKYRYEIEQELNFMSAMYGLPESDEMAMGKKTIKRSYTKDTVAYQDYIEYNIQGLETKLINLGTSYTIIDKQGRLREKGELDYSVAFELIMAKHSAVDLEGGFPNELAVAMLAGKLKGVKDVRQKWIYSGKGLLLSRKEYGSDYVYSYNANDQVVQVKCSNYAPHTLFFTYNEKGLPATATVVSSETESYQAQVKPGVYTFSYTFY
jgi:hypothetical protein